MPDKNGDQLITIGENIHRLRKQKGLTQAELATLCGLSAPFLSQIENARANVNLNTLNKICDALEIPVVDLFNEEKAIDVRLIKREKRKWYTLAGRSMESFLLNLNTNIELCIIHLPPGENSGESDQHVGDEICFVVKGTIRTILNNDTVYEMSESDMIYYKSTIPHRWENGGNEIAEFIIINSPATF